ncbi:MAG: putative glycoside hydrolase [Planctomycetota bacterium]
MKKNYMLLLIFSVFCLVFVANESCLAESAELPIAERIAARDFPSVFQAWSPADNLPNKDRWSAMALHDLVWHGPGGFGLVWDTKTRGLAEAFTPESIETGRRIRRDLLKLNPNIILIAEIRYRDAHPSFLPQSHRWWKRNEEGNLVKGWGEGGFICLDFTSPQFREHVAQRARAAVQSGVVDGVMLDWWRDDEHRLELVKAVREEIGDEHLIIANTNDRTAPESASFINGYFMECTRSKTANDWRRIETTLKWAENNLRPPRVNCLETWYHNSREDLYLMRATTTLALTHSDGYCLFSDPNPLPSGDHRHNWYPFWDKSLGKPVGEGVTKDNGTVIREFENGTVVYNPMGNKTVELVFDEIRRSAATGALSARYKLACPDGDIYITIEH